jgi:hypothetical protein
MRVSCTIGAQIANSAGVNTISRTKSEAVGEDCLGRQHRGEPIKMTIAGEVGRSSGRQAGTDDGTRRASAWSVHTTVQNDFHLVWSAMAFSLK